MKISRTRIAMIAVLWVLPWRNFSGSLIYAQDSVSLPNGKVGTAYQYQFQTEGGLAPLVWKVAGGELPPGINLDPAGKLSGVPTTPRRDPYRFVVEVSDASQPPQRFAQSFLLSIQAAGAVIVGVPQMDRDYYKIGVGIDFMSLVQKIRGNR